MQADGLSVMKINVGYGGNQPCMKDSKLTTACFGPFHDETYALQPSDTQSMQHSAIDIGPCNMTEEERDLNKYDRSGGGTRLRDILVQDLIIELQQIGVKDPPKNKKKLQEIALYFGCPLVAGMFDLLLLSMPISNYLCLLACSCK